MTNEAGQTHETGRPNWPLRTYVAGLVALFVVAAGAGILLIRFRTERDGLRSAEQDAQFAAEAAAAPVSEGIDTLKTVLTSLAGSPDITAVLEDPALCTLSFVKVGAFPEGHIDILREDGSVVCSSRAPPGEPTPEGYEGEDWLEEVTSEVAVLAPQVDAARGETVAIVAIRFEGGIAAALVDLEPVGPELARGLGGPRDLEFLLTAADGQTALTRSLDPEAWAGSPISSTPFARGEDAVERPDVDGTDRIYATTTVPDLGWKLHVGADREGALSSATRLYRDSLAIIFAALLVIGLAAFVVQRRITRPIRVISDAVRTAAEGGGRVALAVRGPAELAALTEDFNALTQSVDDELEKRQTAEAIAMEAEAAARASEKTYRLLFDNHPRPMWVYDTKSLAFLEVNDAAVDHYGYSREKWLSMTIGDIRPSEDLPALMQSISRAEAVDTSGPWRHLRADGTTIEVEIASRTVDFGGRAARLVMVEDVTDRERLQRQLSQSQRLESLGSLAGGVAHDFNNLLSVIINYTDFVKEQVVGAMTGESADWKTVGEDLEQVERAAKRAADLTRQLLAFARREVIHPQVLSLNDTVEQIEPLLRRTLGEHVELVTSCAPDVWPILADGGQVEQVLVNLAVNGRDAMPAAGSLTIETENVEVDDAYATTRPNLSPGRYVRLRVSDTGVGMERSVIERAFDPFFTTKPKGEGTGLGLATIYGIVTQAGGNVQIYSEPGLGTSITALFPATEQTAPIAAAGTPEVESWSGTESVLVAEDEDAIRELTRRLLERNGYKVLSAASGSEAIALAQDYEGDIDLLITDVVMPKMLGREVAERVSKSRPQIRVLFMSGYAQPFLGSQGTLDPGVELIEKPFSETALLSRVAEVLRSD